MATMTHRFRSADRARQEKFQRLLRQQGTILWSRKQLLRNGPHFASSGVLDLEEHAVDAEEQGIGFSVLEMTSRTVHGIETALQRLEAGEFGTCSDCRCRIPAVRLRAVPFASRCLACQAKHDIAGVASIRAGFTAH